LACHPCKNNLLLLLLVVLLVLLVLLPLLLLLQVLITGVCDLYDWLHVDACVAAWVNSAAAQMCCTSARFHCQSRAGG
jgi:hypothetical protein